MQICHKESVMTLEVEYKDNRFGYIEMKYVLDIRDFHKKENKYVILSEKEYKKLLEEIEYLKKNPTLF